MHTRAIGEGSPDRVLLVNLGLLVAACVTLVLLLGVAVPVASAVYSRLMAAFEVAEPPVSAWAAAVSPVMMAFCAPAVIGLVLKERLMGPCRAAVVNAVVVAVTVLVGLAVLFFVTMPLFQLARSLTV